jgi:hypothetical protein
MNPSVAKGNPNSIFMDLNVRPPYTSIAQQLIFAAMSSGISSIMLVLSNDG